MTDTATLRSDGHKDDIEAVLSARDELDLFGTNEKRARIRYRRLAAAVHPDANGGSSRSEDAMRRLNELWDAFQARFRAKNGPKHASVTHKTVEMARNDTYVVLLEGERTLVVDRRVAGGLRKPVRHENLDEILLGTPTWVASASNGTLIAQKDGPHEAFYVSQPQKRVFTTLLELRYVASGGVLVAEDAAWITKRVIYLSAALAKANLVVSHDTSPRDIIGVAPFDHSVGIFAPWELEKVCHVGIGEQRRLLESYLDAVSDFMANDLKTRKVAQFIKGAIIDGYTESSALMEEYDLMLYEVFGGRTYHGMSVTEDWERRVTDGMPRTGYRIL